MNNLQIKEAKIDDLQTIQRILKENKLPYQDIQTSNVQMFFAYANSEFIGIIGLEKFETIALLRSMVIKEEYRNQGYGKILCKKLLTKAKNEGIKDVYLLTTTAKSFFEHLGFNTINREDSPDVIKSTTEFSTLCPATAQCMKIEL